MKDFNTNTDNNDVWLTPPYIIEALGGASSFDLDPCYLTNRPWDTARKHYALPEHNGLAEPWYGRVWLNPPYGNKTFNWMKKLADHGNGTALIFARTETKGFHAEIWKRADYVFFFEGRLKFYHADGTQGGTANAPSCLVAYGENNVKIIRQAWLDNKIKGCGVHLK